MYVQNVHVQSFETLEFCLLMEIKTSLFAKMKLRERELKFILFIVKPWAQNLSP